MKLFNYQFWKRIIDILFASIGIMIFFIPIALIGMIIKISSKGPIIHWSNRIGINNSRFRMVKLRTLKTDTPVIPSNIINSRGEYFIRFGKILRNSGIDELPQLYNILKGDMSIVGPRPVIVSETDLISYRTEKGINKIKPGLTGLAQINGRDKLSIFNKIKYDETYLEKMNMSLDIKIIFLTNYWLIKENIFAKWRKNNLNTKTVGGTD
jgi:O-antigen biosynthesis protein WbqP